MAMSQSTFEVRKAVYARLTSEVSATPTYSYTPPNTSMPYIVIGEVSSADLGTKTTDIVTYEVTLHAFDKGQGSSQAIDGLIQSVYNALHWQEDSMTVTGYNLVKCQVTNTTVMQQGDIADYYWHGVVRVELIVEDV